MFCAHIRLEENRTCSRLRGLGFGEVCAQQRPFAHSRCQFLSAGRVLRGWMHLSADWRQVFAACPSSKSSDARRPFLGHIVARTVFYSCCCHDSTDTSSVRWRSKESRCVTQVFESGTALGGRRTFTGFYSPWSPCPRQIRSLVRLLSSWCPAHSGSAQDTGTCRLSGTSPRQG